MRWVPRRIVDGTVPPWSVGATHGTVLARRRVSRSVGVRKDGQVLAAIMLVLTSPILATLFVGAVVGRVLLLAHDAIVLLRRGHAQRGEKGDTRAFVGELDQAGGLRGAGLGGERGGPPRRLTSHDGTLGW